MIRAACPPVRVDPPVHDTPVLYSNFLMFSCSLVQRGKVDKDEMICFYFNTKLYAQH